MVTAAGKIPREVFKLNLSRTELAWLLVQTDTTLKLQSERLKPGSTPSSEIQNACVDVQRATISFIDGAGVEGMALLVDRMAKALGVRA